MIPRVEERPPSREEIEELLELAVRAPNHFATEPWRFYVLAGDERERLARAIADEAIESGTDETRARGDASKKVARAPVIVVAGTRIGFERTFQESLDSVMRGRAPVVEDEEAPEEPPAEEEEEEPAAPEGDVNELLEQAVRHFERAEDALRDGDLATYQRENEAGRRAVEEAQERGGG